MGHSLLLLSERWPCNISRAYRMPYDSLEEILGVISGPFSLSHFSFLSSILGEESLHDWNIVDFD